MKVLGVNQYSFKNQNLAKNQNLLSFRRLVNGVEYPDDLVDEAERLLKESEKVDINKYKQSLGDCLIESKFQPLEWLMSPFVTLLGSDDPMLESRIALGCCTLGLSEVLKLPEAGIRKLISNKKAEKHVAKLKDCMLDLIKEKGSKIR